MNAERKTHLWNSGYRVDPRLESHILTTNNGNIHHEMDEIIQIISLSEWVLELKLTCL